MEEVKVKSEPTISLKEAVAKEPLSFDKKKNSKNTHQHKGPKDSRVLESLSKTKEKPKNENPSSPKIMQPGELIKL